MRVRRAGVRSYHLEVRGISVEVVRKDIENLYIRVYPPIGRVQVAAPRLFDDEAVRLAVISRLGWILRMQVKYTQQDRQSPRELVTGESQYFAGRRYHLEVIEQQGLPSVRLSNNTTMELRVRPGTCPDKRLALLDKWYREQLQEQFPPLLAQWEAKVGMTIAEVRIKKMKTRWGSCNPAARRIWLNLELAKKPASCLEYVLVHEMAHLLERRHDARFRQLMDRLLPSWRRCREELNRGLLAHKGWAAE